jgi:hypothetical protein
MWEVGAGGRTKLDCISIFVNIMLSNEGHRLQPPDNTTRRIMYE